MLCALFTSTTAGGSKSRALLPAPGAGLQAQGWGSGQQEGRLPLTSKAEVFSSASCWVCWCSCVRAPSRCYERV